MSTFLNVLLDLLLGGSLLFFILVMIKLVVQEPNAVERLYRGMALVAGAVVALGASAAHVGFASYTVNSLSGARPGGSIITPLSVIIPGGVGAAFGWYFLRIMKRSTARGLRLVAFVGMLTAVAFAEIFAQATNVKGVELGTAAIPNASFIAGLIISLIAIAPGPGDEPENKPSKLGLLFGDLVSRKAPESVVKTFVSSHAGGVGAPKTPSSSEYFDPFEE